MRNTEKRGFTLVELMVVIVIMGILAAVGVPKLTGAIAKSKASEVAPAANSYVKLQHAYVTEHKKLGGWKRIGYSKPKSNNFSYTCGDVCKKTTVDALGENGLVGWEASNLVSLGDCPYGQKWTVTIVTNGTDDEGNTILDFNANVNNEACVAISGDWGVVRGSENMEVASNNDRLNPLNISTYSKKYNDNNTQSLARAILSGNSSTNIGKIYSEKNSTAEQKSFSDLYNIDGFVLNTSVNGKTVGNWLKEQVAEGSVTTYVKVVTILGDASNRNDLTVGEVYKGTQSLYYGGEKNSGQLQSLSLYGTREIYGKVVKKDASGNPIVEYYLDEALTQKIDVNENTEFEKYEEEIADPMLAEWNYDSPLSKTHIESNDVSKAICSNARSWVDKSGEKNTVYTDIGIKGYVMNDGVKVYTVDDKDENGQQLYKVDDNGDFVLDAKGAKIKQQHQEEFATYSWLKEQLPSGTNMDHVRIVSEIHTEEKTLTLGTTYAATQNLFYGKASNGNMYATRDVYALVTSVNADNGLPTVYYFTDKECLHQIDNKTSSAGWTLIN